MDKLETFDALSALFESKYSYHKAFTKSSMAKTTFAEIATAKGEVDISVKIQTPLQYINFCARKKNLTVYKYIDKIKKDSNKSWKVYLFANMILHRMFPKVDEYSKAIDRSIHKIDGLESKDVDTSKPFPPPSFATVLKRELKRKGKGKRKTYENTVRYFSDGDLRALAAIVARIDKIPIYYFVIDDRSKKNIKIK